MSNELLEAEAEKLPHTRCERNEPYQRSRAAAAAGISPPLPGMSRTKCLAPKKYLYFRSFMEREGIDEIGKQVTLSFFRNVSPPGFLFYSACRHRAGKQAVQRPKIDRRKAAENKNNPLESGDSSGFLTIWE